MVKLLTTFEHNRCTKTKVRIGGKKPPTPMSLRPKKVPDTVKRLKSYQKNFGIGFEG